jgi:putative CRISPR-associated protein (TIGR02619 family)
MKTVITTVGTSLFTNYIKSTADDHDRPQIGGLNGEFTKLDKTPYSEQTLRSRDARNLHNYISNYWLNSPDKTNASAEIESLIAIQKSLNTDLDVYLIASETILSTLACELIAAFFTSTFDKYRVKIKDDNFVVRGLQVDNVNEFRSTGLLNLFKRINDLIIDENSAPHTIINITGGYKASIPFITIFGQINKIHIYYLYENTGKLISIPPLPISIDYKFFALHNNVLQQLYEGQSGDWEQFKREKNLPDSADAYVEYVEDEGNSLFELNAIGKYFFENYNNSIIIEIEKTCTLVKEQQGNIKQIFNSLRELHEKLESAIIFNSISNNQELLQFIDNLQNHDLSHAQKPSRETYIFKSTDQEQIRIVYQPNLLNSKLILRIFDYKRGGNFNHSTYIQEFQNKMKLIKEPEFTTVLI